MGCNLLLPNDINRIDTYGFFDDMESYVTGARWTALAADSGATVAQGDADGGTAVLTTGGTDNNEAMIKTTKKIFTIADGKTLQGLFRVQYTEANTDDANIYLGFSSAAAADLMVDNGAGPATSHSGVGFFKTDSNSSGNYWSAHTSISTTQNSTLLTAANMLAGKARIYGPLTAGGSSYQVLGIVVRPISTTQAEAEFWIDTAGGKNLQLAYKQLFTYTNAAAMNAVAYIKAGGSNSEVLNVDYIAAYRNR